MAQEQKDPISRLADRGEQVVGRITDLPGAKMLIDKAATMAKNVDAMQKELRSLGPLQKRVAAIERRLDKLEGKGSTTRKKTTTRRTTTAAKKTTTPKRSTGRSPSSS
jgi:RNA processing factor Prp31